MRDIDAEGMAMDEFQLRAIRHAEGPALVVAGPGSGKTKVIAERLKHLVRKEKVPAGCIVAISFTKAASKELRSRSAGGGKDLSDVLFGTFHSFFLRILKESGRYGPSDVLDEEEKKKVIAELLRRELYTSFVAPEVLDAILPQMERTDPKGSDPVTARLIGKLREEYQAYKRVWHRIDFDDILVETKRVLEEEEGLLESLRARYRYYFIDEYQDINLLQFETIRLLLGERQNLFAVGDEDQSIYGFRGADPKFLTEFETCFAGAVIYRLTRSYRCPQEILSASNALIGHNQNRRQKSMVSGTGRTGQLRLTYCRDEKEQAEHIRKQIARRAKPEECMVIYRSHRQALPLIKALSDANIPFALRERRFHLFEHFIYKDLAAFLRLALRWQEGKIDLRSEEDIKDLNRILNKPHRQLRPLSLQRPQTFRGRFDQAVRRGKIERVLGSTLRRMRLDSFREAVSEIMEKLGYGRYLNACSQCCGLSPELFEEVLGQISALVSEGADVRSALSELSQWKLFCGKKLKKAEGSDCVLLTTAHGAKGLERDRVFILSLNQGVFPHIRSLQEDLEEERRLLYVAMTRSRLELELLTLSGERQGESSVFLSEIHLPEILQIAKKSFCERK